MANKVEYVTLTGIGAINVLGNSLSSTITGNDAATKVAAPARIRSSIKDSDPIYLRNSGGRINGGAVVGTAQISAASLMDATLDVTGGRGHDNLIAGYCSDAISVGADRIKVGNGGGHINCR